MKIKFFCLSFSLLIVTTFFLDPVVTQAQSTGSGLGVMLEIENNEGAEGNIVSISDKGTYRLSSSDYDVKMFGVIVNNPPLSLEDSEIVNSKIVVSSGQVMVRVSTESGDIKKGDFITSSTKKGVGKKALSSGYVLGIALEDFENAKPGETKLILVSLNIGNQFISTNPRSNLLQIVRSGLDSPSLAPLESLRYLLAGLSVVASLLIGFASFSRTSSTSIEAMGRNPLAKNTIRTTVFFNFLLTGLIMFTGVFLAYLILII